MGSFAAAGCKKGPVLLGSFHLGRTIEDEGLHIHCTLCMEYSAVPLRLLHRQPLPAYIHTQPRNVGKTAIHYCGRGQRLCSHRLLAGENALLLTTAFASDGRLSGRGCCKESCPVHRICRMIVRILVRNSQIVNIFGTSSEDALIQKSVLQKFLGDFCSCVKRKKLYTSTNEKSSRPGLDFHTLMC